MTRASLLLPLTLLMLGLAAAAPAPARAAATAESPTTASPAQRKSVLLLYDENGDFSGLANLDKSIKASIGNGVPGGVDVYTEFMDLSRFRDPAHQTLLRDVYRKKYAGKRIDLMVGVMAPSLDFLLKHGAEISPGTPIVFCGIDRRELAGLTLPPNTTGVLVKREFKPTLEGALRLHPRTRRVYFIAGTSPFNRYWMEQAQRDFGELEALAGRVELNYLTDLPMESLQAKVARLPPDSIILFLHLFRDGAGQTFNPTEALARVAHSASAPVYVFFDQYVGSGAVGGYVYSVEAHGAKAAELANRVLNGERPSDILVVEASANVNLFDARQLRRWHVNESRLPPNAIVRFRESSFWQRYRWHVAIGLAVIIAQALLILALLVQRRRRHRAELAQQRAQAEVEQKRAELAHVSRVATLGELTGSLAHELGQPFTAILANAAAGVRFLDGPEADLREARETFADICDDAQRAADVIHRLRAMLKRDAPPGFTSVDLNDVIRSTARLVRSDAVRHGVAVHLDLSSVGCPVAGDGVQLQQVILNLITNAFRAMDDARAARDGARRRLDVRTRSTDGADVLVEVADCGTGIADDQLDRIFDPFVTTKPDGLGMGLSICRSIIERHGGTVWAANNPDGGATFSITLPAAAAGAAAAAAAAAAGCGDGEGLRLQT